MPAVDPDPKPFKCRNCGWVLGYSYREPGKHITQLSILRHPYEQVVGVTPVTSASRPAVLFAAEHVNDCAVLCEHCGASTGWYANQNAIEAMIERKSKRNVTPIEKKEVPP
jgi:hypothetical protein